MESKNSASLLDDVIIQKIAKYVSSETSREEAEFLIEEIKKYKNTLTTMQSAVSSALFSKEKIFMVNLAQVTKDDKAMKNDAWRHDADIAVKEIFLTRQSGLIDLCINKPNQRLLKQHEGVVKTEAHEDEILDNLVGNHDLKNLLLCDASTSFIFEGMIEELQQVFPNDRKSTHTRSENMDPIFRQVFLSNRSNSLVHFFNGNNLLNMEYRDLLGYHTAQGFGGIDYSAFNPIALADLMLLQNDSRVESSQEFGENVADAYKALRLEEQKNPKPLFPPLANN